MLLLADASPSPAAVSLTIASIRHPAVEADGITAHVAEPGSGVAELHFARMRIAGVEYEDLAVRCEGFAVDAEGIRCPRGSVRRGGARGADRPPLPFSFSYRPRDGRLELAVTGADAVAWSPLVRRLRGWKPEGRADLRLVADRREAGLALSLRGLRFASRDGLVAGEGMDLDLSARAERRGRGWTWWAAADWSAGELHWAPWYRKAGVRASAEGTLDEEELAVDLARLDLEGLGGVTASLAWDRIRGEPLRWGFVTESLDLAAAAREWVQPWLDARAAPKFRATGHARFAAEWSAGRLRNLYAGLEEARIADEAGHLELHGVEARVPWDAEQAAEATFAVAGGRLGDLPIGGFSVPVALHGYDMGIDRLALPILDGRLAVDDLRAVFDPAAGTWRGRFAGGVEGVSMAKLAAALKLPAMAGSLSARVPGATYADRTLALDGAIEVRVFDGRVTVGGLRIEDPLRRTQRFRADVEARGLDLAMLTRTFSFGTIEGRFDADILGLELAGWTPLRFDARVRGSEGDFPRSISRGALRDISALGGAAGADAVQASPAGLAQRFGYRRIGLGCVLENGVCRFHGLAPEGRGYLIVEGAGIPSVRVIGYNRAVDWNLLVSRIQAVIAGRVKAEIE
ncbi:MAG: hypothetical protein JNK22_15265 [Rhodocyclaceae bacterium]|nr:hypothetical protein [Rhodocyclaceae bacterium]